MERDENNPAIKLLPKLIQELYHFHTVSTLISVKTDHLFNIFLLTVGTYVTRMFFSHNIQKGA